MKQIFRLLFASLFFLTGQAMADMPEFTLGNVSVMGFAPDGRSVTRVDYSYYMGWGNTRVLWFFTLEDTRQYPKEIVYAEDMPDMWNFERNGNFHASFCAVPEACDHYETFSPNLFYGIQAWDSDLSGYLSSDGQTLMLFETIATRNEGEVGTTTHVLKWDNLNRSYEISQTFTLSATEKYALALESALQTNNAQRVLNALGDMGSLCGYSGNFVDPPERVILPLWRFFSAHADQLAEFISVAASCGWTSEGPEPEAFFRYSASIKGVAEHMTACVPLLEKHQAPEIAEAIRKALSGQP